MTTRSVQGYARLAGALTLVSLIAGGFGEAYVPAKLMVPGNAAATASNFIAHEGLARLGFAGYLIEAMCDVGLSGLLYFLLRPVNRDLALLAAFFRLVGTAVFAVAELFYFAPVFILGGAEYLKAFSPEQLHALAMLSLKFYSYGAGLFLAIYGLPSVALGYLMYRSGYIPRFVGILFALSGAGFIYQNLAIVLMPRYASPITLLPAGLAAMAMAGWFLARGVDVQRWQERTALQS